MSKFERKLKEKKSATISTKAKIKKHKKMLLLLVCGVSAVVLFTFIYPYTTPTYTLRLDPKVGQIYNYFLTIGVHIAPSNITSNMYLDYYGNIEVLSTTKDNVTFRITIDDITVSQELKEFLEEYYGLNIENLGLPITGTATLDKNTGEILAGENIGTLAVVYPTISVLPGRPVRKPIFFYHDTWSITIDLTELGIPYKLPIINELVEVTDSEYGVNTTADISMSMETAQVKISMQGTSTLDRSTGINKSTMASIRAIYTVHGTTIETVLKIFYLCRPQNT